MNNENKREEKALDFENNFYVEELEDRLEMSNASIDPHNSACGIGGTWERMF